MISRLVGFLLRAHLGWSLRGGTTSVAWTRRSLAQYRTLARWFERVVHADTLRILRRRAAWAELQRAVAAGSAAPIDEWRCAYVLPLVVALAATPRHVWRLCRRGVGTCRASWWRGRPAIAGDPSEEWLVALRWALLGLVVLWTLGHPSVVAAGPMLGTTYYVSPYGSDSNNGLGPDASHASNKPWLTIAKALGASGIASGDTVYIAPGVYRETVTVNMTSATVTTTVAGDVANAQGFADASGARLLGGEVLWVSTANDFTVGAAPLTLNGRDFLTFSRLVLYGGATGSSGTIAATTATSTDITFNDCVLSNMWGASAVWVTVGAGVAANWTIERCAIWASSNAAAAFQLNRHTADYDVNIQVRNCQFAGGGGGAVSVFSTGAGTGKGGGVDLMNCTAYGNLLAVTDANISTTFPCTVTASVCVSATGLNANTSGQITEDYNLIAGTSSARVNVTAGTHSSSVPADPRTQQGRELMQRATLRPMGEPPALGAALGWGGASGGGNSQPTIDLRSLPRPCGTMTFGDSGAATAGAAKTLTDSGKAWATNYFKGWIVKVTSGTGSGQVKQIASNSGTVLTVDGNWQTNPDNTSTYTIYRGAPATSGTATAGAATTLTDSNAAWATNQWTGFTLAIRSGTGSGQTTTITSNTGTALTVPTWGTNPDNTSQYWIYRKTDENTVNYAAGCFERGNTMVKDTATVRTGSASLRAFGPAVQDFELPVDAVATTVSVYVQYDSTYAGTLPQVKVLNGDECGVSDATATAVGSANTWEQLTLSFTPSRAGIVTIRLQSNCTATLGSAYFDDFELTPRTTPNGFDHYRRGEPVASLGSLLGLARVA